MAIWGMDPVSAHSTLVDFSARRGEGALRLAMHAAPAERFRADLLHLLRLNFLPDLHPSPAMESDVLLAPFCHELGGGYYRFDPEIRSQLLNLLMAEYPDTPEPRVRRVAKFFGAWVEDAGRALKKHVDPVSREYLASLNWVALAYTQPEAAAGQLAAALNGAVEGSDAVVRLQVSSVISSLALPLVSHQRLLSYAAVVEALASGRVDDAASLFSHVEGLEIAPGIKAPAMGTLIHGTRREREWVDVVEETAVVPTITVTQVVLLVVLNSALDFSQWTAAFAAQGFLLEFVYLPAEGVGKQFDADEHAFMLALEDLMGMAFYSKSRAAYAAALFGGWERPVFLPRSEQILDLFAACPWIVWFDAHDARSKSEQAAEMIATASAIPALNDDEIEKRLRAQVALFEGVFEPGTGDLAKSRLQLASILARRNEYEEALSLNRVVLDSLQTQGLLIDAHTLLAQRQTADCLQALGRLEEALPVRRAILATLRELHIEANEETESAMLDLAELLYDFDQEEEAEVLARRVYESVTRLWGETHLLAVRAGSLIDQLQSKPLDVEILNCDLDVALSTSLYTRLKDGGLRVHQMHSSEAFHVNRTGSVVAILIGRKNIESFTLQAQANVVRSARIAILPIAVDEIAHHEFVKLFGPDIPLIYAKSVDIEELHRGVRDALLSVSEPATHPAPQVQTPDLVDDGDAEEVLAAKPRIEKTVFLSYRGMDASWATAISQNLTEHGYDVFSDITSFAAGDIETKVLQNIRARAHFILILTPSMFERGSDPGDWLAREIEIAIEERRNIVLFTLENFQFASPVTKSQLLGKLAALSGYPAVSVGAKGFMDAMHRLRELLNVDLEASPHSASVSALEAAKEQQAAKTTPVVQKEELSAQAYFERGYHSSEPEEAIRCYTDAIRLNPTFALAYYNRAILRQEKADTQGALQDYNQAIRLNPGDADAYMNRGVARDADGDQKGALRDYDQAIRLAPEYADAFIDRGAIRQEMGDLDGALQDFDQALRLAPDAAEIFYNRGIVRQEKGDFNGALQDYDQAIRLRPDYAEAIYNRGALFHDRGDLDKALHDYTEAIRLSPSDPITYFNRAQILAGKHDYRKALFDYRKYLQLGGGLDNGDQEQVEEEIDDLEMRIGDK